jgi:hypothetical protein
LKYPTHNTPSSQQSLKWVTITHPHHPLYGQQVEIVRIRRGVDPDLIVRFPDGLHAAVAMSLTDYAVSAEDDLSPVPIHLLDFNGLCQIVQFIDRIRQEKCDLATVSEGRPSSVANSDYD